jgi:hypothetical protein
LADGPRGEWFHIYVFFGAVRGLAVFGVPAREGEEEEEANEGEDYGDDAGDLLVGALYPWGDEQDLH